MKIRLEKEYCIRNMEWQVVSWVGDKKYQLHRWSHDTDLEDVKDHILEMLAPDIKDFLTIRYSV